MTAVAEALEILEADETIGSVELSRLIGVTESQLSRWLSAGVLTATRRPGRFDTPDRQRTGTGYRLRWTPAQMATAGVVAAAWRQGHDRRTLKRVAAVCAIALDGRGKAVYAEWPDLIVVTNPTTAGDLAPLDRLTLVVQL